MMLLLSKKTQATKNTLLLICCLALYISCGVANTNVQAATMLRAKANHRQGNASPSRHLEQRKESKENIQEWPDDDDDDDIDIIQSKNNFVENTEDNGNANAENATSTIDNDETEKSTQQVSVEEDVEGGDEEIITIDEDIESSGKLQNDNSPDVEEADINNEVGNLENTTLVMGEEEEIPTTDYHRSQSTIQNEAPVDSTGDTRTFDQSENIDMNKGQVSEDIKIGNSNVVAGNEINDGGNNMVAVEENANNVDTVAAPMEQANPQQQPPLENAFVNYNEDDEEESFLAMIQSTLQVLFLAAFFSSGLVFRRRVMDRMNDHPSMNVSHAIQEEVVKVLTDLASWLSESQTESRRDVGGGRFSMPTIPEGGSSIGGSGSSRTETIPLATATDEEWGWDDEDVSGNLELSGVGGDNTTEEDDLAMAIAMSLSEPANVDRSETVRPADAVSNHSAPAMEFAVEKSPIENNQLEQIAPPPPTDTIEDLLGQMSSVGGPVISSFGQKTTNIEPKSKPKPIRNDEDDIFESMGMGLSSFATKTGPSQQQTNIPSSTLLKAESIDEDDDDWGDDGDLDDLLLED